MAMTTLTADARPAKIDDAHVLPFHLRTAIEEELGILFNRVEVLLARLDADDGDIDLEEDDYSGDYLEIHGEAGDELHGFLPTRPIYAVDQTSGPINHEEATIAYHRAELGMVQSPDGRWRMPA